MDQANDTVLFSGRAHVNGIATTAEVTASGEVRWTDGGGGRRRLAVEKEVIGFLKDGCCKVIVHAVLERGEGTIVRSGGNNGGMVRKRFLFEVEDEKFGRGLCENIQRCIDSLGRPKKVFVLVNPFGGSKCASKIFLDDVKPLLEDANVEYTLQETKHRLHANEVALSLDLSKYDGIICVSGDGTLIEPNRVKAFVLEPGSRTDDPTKGGIIDVDGEVLARGKGTYKAEQKALMKYDKLQLIVDHGSFKRYTDLKQQNQIDDLEMGRPSGNDEGNLDKFFEDVENVKQDMKTVENLYKRLQDSNEEGKTVHNAKTMKALRAKMDTDVSQVLKQVKLIKRKLEALEKSNTDHRRLPGCGPGSSADRTRISVVSGLGKKLKDMMDDFQRLRGKMADEYKETVERRYFTITGEKANEETIENLIASGESESFMQKAIQEQGRGQIMDTISEIQERHDTVKEIERNLLELHQVFMDMAALVEAQGHQINDIESHVMHASSFVRRGTEQLTEARVQQKSSRKWACIGVIAVVVIAVILLFPILAPMVHLK